MRSSKIPEEKKKKVQCVAAHRVARRAIPRSYYSPSARKFFFNIHWDDREAMLVSTLQQQHTEQSYSGTSSVSYGGGDGAATSREGHLTKLGTTEFEIFFPAHTRFPRIRYPHARDRSVGRQVGKRNE